MDGLISANASQTLLSNGDSNIANSNSCWFLLVSILSNRANCSSGPLIIEAWIIASNHNIYRSTRECFCHLCGREIRPGTDSPSRVRPLRAPAHAALECARRSDSVCDSQLFDTTAALI